MDNFGNGIQIALLCFFISFFSLISGFMLHQYKVDQECHHHGVSYIGDWNLTCEPYERKMD